MDPQLKNYLHLIGFCDDIKLSELANEHRQDMVIMFHGMGCSVIVGNNPKKRDSYFIGFVGGQNGYDAELNMKNFEKIGQPGTRYFTAKEIKEIDFAYYPSIPDSAPAS